MAQTEAGGARITAEEFEALAWQGVPYVGQLGCVIERFAAGEVVIRLPWRELVRRPGGTICGPALMALADIALRRRAVDDRPRRARHDHEHDGPFSEPAAAGGRTR
jgi:acyl-coenzyme A thioesterase PaaI-like protein